MKLTRENLKKTWPEGYQLPKFDIEAMIQATTDEPIWLHMGAGNIFRIFVAGLQQDLLDAGHTDKGIIVYESYDEGIIPASFTPYDNLTLAVTLNADGSADKRIIASMADAFGPDLTRLQNIFSKPSLQMVTITITEKGYGVEPDNICPSPDKAKTAMEQLAAGLYARFITKAPPLALVAMDNFAENGTKVANAVKAIAAAWNIPGFIEYVNTQAYPWTMIDKITPQPAKAVVDILEKEGYTSTEITHTQKNTTVASFVNAEGPQYLVIEDNFPNGRPPLEKAIGKGVFFTDQDTVRKADQMKVCACLNPLHTILGVCGSLLDYPTISSCMQDKHLVAMLYQAAEEAMPTVANPGIINPQDFFTEVITKRFPNPFIPDTPARINADASQKIPVRFGVTLKTRLEEGLDIAGLEAIPRFIALWLRYRMGTDDTGATMELSPDPRLPETVLPIGREGNVDLRPILSDANIFGVDLYAVGLGAKIEAIFAELTSPGAVNKLLTQWYPQ
ncbi:MAG: mannitol dehydrogenase family protein [Defluviitaleaceae bacterium]|nr:mannitol dehydrogenase family protein [Defluviitaleaceae bacterium]